MVNFTIKLREKNSNEIGGMTEFWEKRQQGD